MNDRLVCLAHLSTARVSVLFGGGGVGVEPGGWGMWVGRGTLLGPEGSGGPLVMGGLCGCLVPPLAEPCVMCGVGGGWACCLRSA
jgi:hypothetical protein